MSSAWNGSAAAGEIVLERVSRAFAVRADRGSTLKDLLIGRRGDGPAPVQALRDVDLRIAPGETVGLIGRNGAGKTSTLRVLGGIIPPTAGRVACGGQVVTLLELGAGFSRDFSGRENIYLNGALHGLTKAEVEQRLDSIVAFSELHDFIDVPVKTYSAGMMVRLGFAIAAHLDADVLLIDELLAVGDEAFQRKCLRRISERIALGTTVVLVSHDAGAIERVCERVVVLDGGRVVFDGSTADGLLFYHRLLGTEHADATPTPGAGREAFEITELELQDEAGRRCRVFRSGQPMRVTLALRAREAALAPVLELEVRDHQGTRLFATDTAPTLSDGAVRVAFEVPRVSLLGGDYDVVLRAHDSEAGARARDRVAGFSVAHEPGADGVADLRGAWSVRTEAGVTG
ncbi:MAG: lipopolysaccharide transport system ATP-binding protein [Solirubrobacteraceae bacterium]|nr:lipopolysaccharide transport system ATP-binding protein [Solirubrobacteraceae bacterium]